MAHSDDSDDSEFEDTDDSGSFGTVPSEFLHDNEISEWTQSRVLSVDPNEGRCLVENSLNPSLVDFCHCYRRKLMHNDSLMRNIEWHWNIKLHSLNLDSHRNIFCAGASIHTLHHRNDWMLLPDHDIIEQYHQSLIHKDNDKWIATRESFPNIPNRNDFQYTFIPLSKAMKGIAIHRQSNIPRFEDSLTPDDITTYVYPFDTVPVLTSHLHPKYVILEAGRKLDRLRATSTLEITTKYPILVKIAQICHAWTAERPSGAMNDASYNSVRVDENGFVTNDISDNENSDDDGYSDQTQPARFGFRREDTHMIRRKRRKVAA